ncbi:MAG: hypothetical protein JWP78_293 [Mucilaginibacter sp.]|nr:hypothetical protein [Mucilaginibacter sp.]
MIYPRRFNVKKIGWDNCLLKNNLDADNSTLFIDAEIALF